MMADTRKTPNATGKKPVDKTLVDFGSETIPADSKQARVNAVFRDVAQHYDMMNDLMSMGIHRHWKNILVGMLQARPDRHLLDLAGGTGDIAVRFLQAGGGRATICDINPAMIKHGKQRLSKQHPNLAQELSQELSQGLSQGLSWLVADACTPPLADACVDVVSIGFGLRNITDRQACLESAYRLLKPGGGFYCLEFSHPPSQTLRLAYRTWSRLLPSLGGLVAGERQAYDYLVESIKRFPNQQQLAAMLGAAGFAGVRYRNLSGGIVAIHAGWKK